jgi:hypothetical protein
MAKFDAYCATIREVELPNIAETLAFRMGAHVDHGHVQKRFGQTLQIVKGGRPFAWVGEHQSDTDRYCYLEAKGPNTPLLAQSLRFYFPEHSVPRADVAEDFDGEGVYDQLVRVIRHYKGKRVFGKTELPDNLEDGRTYNTGRRGNVAYMRTYEKGKTAEFKSAGRPNWVRAEAEIRPQYGADKVAASKMSPLQMLGFSSWCKAVWEGLLLTDIERFEPEIRESSHEKTQLFIARNYRRFLETCQEDGIDFMRTCQEIWSEDDKAAEAWKKQEGERRAG